MASKKIKLNKLDPKVKKVFSESEVGVLIEHFDNTLQLVAEGQVGLERRMNSLDGKVDSLDNRMGNLENRMDSLDSKVDSLDSKFDSLDSKVDSLDSKVDSLGEEMRSNFKTIFEYLARIDDEVRDIKKELKNKADKKDLESLEKRIARVEIDLETCKRIIAAKNN